MSGLAVIQNMRDELRLDIPIILITARHAEKDIVEGLEAGADEYRVKPAHHLECVARVESALRRANSLRVDKSLKNKPVFSALITLMSVHAKFRLTPRKCC